jgi:uncharacterized membrane protein required for colicin V production
MPPALPALEPAIVAAFRVADGAVLLLLVLFGAWGVLRGALRQSLSLGVLAGALVGAGAVAPVLEPTVAKVTALEPGEQLAAAWGASLFGLLLAGSILLAFLAPRLPARADGLRARIAGGLLGALKGGLVLVIAGYVVLGASGSPGPSLRRDATGAPGASPPLVERVQGSVAGDLLAEGGQALTRWLDVPPWIAARVESVNRRLGAGRAGTGSPGRRRPRAD